MAKNIGEATVTVTVELDRESLEKVISEIEEALSDLTVNLKFSQPGHSE